MLIKQMMMNAFLLGSNKVCPYSRAKQNPKQYGTFLPAVQSTDTTYVPYTVDLLITVQIPFSTESHRQVLSDKHLEALRKFLFTSFRQTCTMDTETNTQTHLFFLPYLTYTLLGVTRNPLIIFTISHIDKTIRV